MNRDKIGTQTCYVPFSTLMYIACLCPNLVSVHFYAIPVSRECGVQSGTYTCITCNILLPTHQMPEIQV